ncbi:MAG: InlB B-repeat-containing protein, partial [Clostridia bacterium]|nr:InlB B-repeat-containing protein [Clostridia bacterium]
AVASEGDAERVKTYLYFDKNAEDAVDGATTETLVYINDEIIPALTTDRPTREGYTFAGWAADAEGTAIAADAVVTAAGATVYAKWISGIVNVTYKFVAPEHWYVVNETLKTDYELYWVFEDGTELLVDQSLYTVSALPTTDTASYEDCIGWQTLEVYFNDTTYGNVYETSFKAFVIPNKLILEEESPLNRVSKDNLGKNYASRVTNDLTMDLLYNVKEKVSVQAVLDEFINMYFVNYFTTPEEIGCEVRLVKADGTPYKTANVGTGARVQLLIGGVVVDEVQVVVLGDTSGDGRINESDLEAISNHRNRRAPLTGVYYLAGDVSSTADINESDVENINLYRNRKYNLFEAWDNASHVYSRDYSERFANISAAQ